MQSDPDIPTAENASASGEELTSAFRGVHRDYEEVLRNAYSGDGHAFCRLIEIRSEMWLGWVPVEESSLYIRVLGSRRVEALRYLKDAIDRLKLDVPIWKRVTS